MIRTALFACALMAAPAAASAQAFIIGGGLAKDCFTKVRDDAEPFRQLDRLCTLALQQESMTTENRAATYVNRGIARMRAERYDGAIDDYERALGLDSDLGAAYLNMGAALIFIGDFEMARDKLDLAIELQSQDMFAAHYNRAIAREKTGDIQGAYADFQRSAQLKPDWDLPQRQLDRFTVVGTN